MKKEKKELQIRILPMSKKEFKGDEIKDVQDDYFLGRLKNRNGKFRTKSDNLKKAASNSFILFRYDKHIIASAVYIETLPIEKDDEFYEEYNFAHFFYPETIRTFKPIPVEEFKPIQDITPGQPIHKIDYSKKEEIEKLIKDYDKK